MSLVRKHAEEGLLTSCQRAVSAFEGRETGEEPSERQREMGKESGRRSERRRRDDGAGAV